MWAIEKVLFILFDLFKCVTPSYANDNDSVRV